MDESVSAYDQEFSYSRIGLLQCEQVWDHLDTMLHDPGMSILELNCGTGIDAVHMARMGHTVLATDLSDAMLSTARENAKQHGLEDRITFRRLAFDDLFDQPFKEKFDLVFSNFGGLNCIDRPHLQALMGPIADLLKPRGRFVAVLMPDRCAAETIHHVLRGDLREAFRRGRHDPVWAGLSGTGVVTWFHSPAVCRKLTAKHFRTIAIRPIGLFVPPTYLDPHFRDHPRSLARLARWDARARNWRGLARYADHYLIDLERIS